MNINSPTTPDHKNAIEKMQLSLVKIQKSYFDTMVHLKEEIMKLELKHAQCKLAMSVQMHQLNKQLYQLKNPTTRTQKLIEFQAAAQKMNNACRSCHALKKSCSKTNQPLSTEPCLHCLKMGSKCEERQQKPRGRPLCKNKNKKRLLKRAGGQLLPTKPSKMSKTSRLPQDVVVVESFLC